LTACVVELLSKAHRDRLSGYGAERSAFAPIDEKETNAER
jgi:hypothetical protein